MAPTPDRPNVLLIMDDQHRFDFLGCAGAEFVRTPNLHRIARAGVRFGRCTTTSPLCAPARISLATGLLPHRAGALTNQAFLPLSHRTYYQRLRDAGYLIGCVGKLDLAKPDHYNGMRGDRPWTYSWGFTDPHECAGKMHAGNHATPVCPYTRRLAERGLLADFHADYRARAARGWNIGASWDSVLPPEEFEDTYIGRYAADWIRSAPDDFPWHYFVSFVGPHDPFDPPEPYAEQYRHAAVPPAIADEMEGKPAWVRARAREYPAGATAEARRQYCAAIQAIDDGVGLILDALQERGWLEKTYILFSSDHGEMVGDHGLQAKSVMYEPSVHVPLLAAGPGIPGGRTSEALVELHDLNPTICELAGLPPQEGIDARSFAPVLRGEADRHRDAAVSVIRNAHCLCTERLKYIRNINDAPELYDLDEDPHELHNLAEEEPETRAELDRQLTARMMRGGCNR